MFARTSSPRDQLTGKFECWPRATGKHLLVHHRGVILNGAQGSASTKRLFRLSSFAGEEAIREHESEVEVAALQACGVSGTALQVEGSQTAREEEDVVRYRTHKDRINACIAGTHG